MLQTDIDGDDEEGSGGGAESKPVFRNKHERKRADKRRDGVEKMLLATAALGGGNGAGEDGAPQKID